MIRTRPALISAVFALCLWTPANAAASFECPLGLTQANGTGAANWLSVQNRPERCVTFEEQTREEQLAQAAYQAQEAAGEAARQRQEALNEKHETGGPPAFLRVKAVSVHGQNYSSPGHTDINVSTTKWADVRVEMVYPGRSWRPDEFHFKEALQSEAGEWGEGESDGIVAPWSCHYPMLVEEYVVTARGETGGAVEAGPGLVVRGRFTGTVSRRWCIAAKKREGELFHEERVYVANNGCQGQAWRPLAVTFACGDGNLFATGISYSRYGGKAAAATATFHLNDCLPYCAAGHFHTYSGNVTFRDIVRCRGVLFYSRAYYSFAGNSGWANISPFESECTGVLG